ncbi:MAG: hypothetical protein NTY55_01030 [Flavobacteriia bacterium]|jgi:hypothetical protein|nr:hypothetical protein [Flavobacteriia bacterium]
MRKKIISSVFLLGCSLSAFSLEKEVLPINKEVIPQICCVRTASNQSTGESVSVRACVDVTGDAVIDKGKACARAKSIATKALTALNDTPK